MKRIQLAACAALLLLLATPAARAEDEAPRKACALDAALEAMGIGEADLGYRPKAHWPRYPHPRTVPYVMPFFEDLLANPLDTYEFTRTLGNAVEDFLTPQRLRATPAGKGGNEWLYKLGVMLATERRIGGFRVFGIDTSQLPAGAFASGKDPLEEALRGLSILTGTDLAVPPVAPVPVPLRAPLATLVNQLASARQWIHRGLRRVTPEQRKRLFACLADIASNTPDGTEYYPVVDEVAGVVDEHSLHFGCLQALQAVQNARRSIGALDVPEGGWPEFEFRLATPYGTLLFDNKPGSTRSESPFLVVRFGAGGITGPVGATAPERSLSVALLMGAQHRLASDGDSRGTLASGVLGCGIVYAAGDVDQSYETGHWGQGAGFFGLGALIDEGGDDVYEMRSVGQGAAYFGAGLLLDAAGRDKYVLREGDGQGFGGPGGIGILGDRSGDDFYYVEPLASKAGRGDYHSENEVAVSNAQGVGSGRRGDLTDGHVWAGGLGALIDVEGDDVYKAGNFSQGLGYWYGTGLLWDGGGQDQYQSVYFTQGSGAHFAIGALIDEGGNDEYLLEKTAGAAQAFGWDVVNAFLIDRGDGNDRYDARRISLGVAEVRSNAFFIDEGGDDTYLVAPKGKFLGDVDTRQGYRQAGRTSAFTAHLGQVAVFLDLGGTDRYLRRAADGSVVADESAGDGRTWNVRKADAGAAHGPNVSVGADSSGMDLRFLRAWPRRGAPAPGDGPRASDRK
jgi:hypothetical protein